MGTNWVFGIKSVGFARESAYGTENTTDGDFLWLPAEVSVPTLARKVEDLKVATGQVGAYEAPIVGSKHGTTFTLKFPLRTFKAGYAAATDAVSTAGVVSPEYLLLANALGSNAAALVSSAALKSGAHLATVAYSASDVASYTAGPPATVTATATNPAAGTFLFASTDANDAAPIRSWVKTASGHVATLSEVPQNVTATGDNIWQTAVAWLSDAVQAPLTFRITGNAASQKLALISCVCTGWVYHPKAGESATIELTFLATDWNQYATGGALWSYGNFNRLAPMLAGNGRDGRLTFGDAATGGVAVDGFNNLQIKCDYTLAYIPSHNKQQGIAAAIVTDRKLSVTCEVPFDSAASFTGSVPAWDMAFESGAAKCLTLTVGDRPGSVFSCYMPAMHLASQPTLKDEGGLLYHVLNFRPSRSDSEGTSGTVDASTTPADSVFKMAIG